MFVAKDKFEKACKEASVGICTDMLLESGPEAIGTVLGFTALSADISKGIINELYETLPIANINYIILSKAISNEVSKVLASTKMLDGSAETIMLFGTALSIRINKALEAENDTRNS